MERATLPQVGTTPGQPRHQGAPLSLRATSSTSHTALGASGSLHALLLGARLLLIGADRRAAHQRYVPYMRQLHDECTAFACRGLLQVLSPSTLLRIAQRVALPLGAALCCPVAGLRMSVPCQSFKTAVEEHYSRVLEKRPHLKCEPSLPTPPASYLLHLNPLVHKDGIVEQYHFVQSSAAKI